MALVMWFNRPRYVRSLASRSRPNITGSFKESGDEIGENGCFYSERTQTGWVDASDGGLKKKVFIDASRSSSAYGNASTVQPSSMQLLACIKS